MAELLKKELRKKAKELLKACGASDIKSWSCGICARCVNTLKMVSPSTLMLYSPVEAEPDPSAILDWGIRNSIRILFPRIENGTIVPYSTQDPAHALKPGFLNIMEPDPGVCSRHEGSIDAVLVPGLAFDSQGFRLGRGGGYFDRFTAAHKESIFIGTAFETQMLDAIPRDTWDKSVDIIVTQQRTIPVSRRANEILNSCTTQCIKN